MPPDAAPFPKGLAGGILCLFGGHCGRPAGLRLQPLVERRILVLVLVWIGLLGNGAGRDVSTPPTTGSTVASIFFSKGSQSHREQVPALWERGFSVLGSYGASGD